MRRNFLVKKFQKRAMFVGCSHGHYANADALRQVLDFAKEFSPHHRVHLGDAWDLAAFRLRARGTPDESESYQDDTLSAELFLQEYKPTLFFFGNHEDRLYYLRKSGSELIRIAADAALQAILDFFEKLKCPVVPYASIASRDSWRLFGDTLAGHGFLYGENATRDHVELLGRPCIHAHDHRAKMQAGRMVGAPMGYSVGTLARIPAMHYAKARRSTASWSGAIVYGEYGEGISQWQIKLLHRSEEAWVAAPEPPSPKRSTRLPH
ncbi:MAG: hypothetical protein QXS54_03015 [Candidatus Methanomethylicaceae archaeon]